MNRTNYHDTRPEPYDRPDLERPVPGELRSGEFAPRRRRWPGLLAATVLGAGIAAIAVSSLYDERTLGERVDAGVAAAGDRIETAAENSAQAAGRIASEAAETASDAAITAAVKTALAADPALSALKIDVTTSDGVVSLEGPAPDQRSR